MNYKNERLIKKLILIVFVFFTTNGFSQITLDITGEHLPKTSWQDTSVVIDGYDVDLYKAKYKNNSVKVAGSTQGDGGAGYIQWTVKSDVGTVYNTSPDRRMLLYINEVYIDTISIDSFLVVNHALENQEGDVYKLVVDNDRQSNYTVDAVNEIQFTTEFTSGNTMKQIELNFYPNPANNHIVVVGENVSKVSIFNTTGMLIQKTSKLENNMINIENLIPGCYIFNAYFENGEFASQKFIKR